MTRNAELRRGEILLQMVLALGTLLVATNVVSPYLVLIHHYGWTRVYHDHLRVLAMPKHHPWPVSNGDTIHSDWIWTYPLGPR